jgi:ABC-type transporter Mla MlaB component
VQQTISDGMRFFIFDFTDVRYIDSTGFGELASALTRINMRAGKMVLLNCQPAVRDLLQVTRLLTTFQIADDLQTAISLIRGKASEKPPEVKYEDKFSIAVAEEKGKKNFVVTDKFSEEPTRTEYRVREIPPQQESKSVSPKWLVLVVLTALVTLGVTVWGLVWVAKAVSSIALLSMIFALALLFFVLLSAVVLLLSGHLSEKTAAKLFGTVMGKIPGLGTWLPRTKKQS